MRYASLGAVPASIRSWRSHAPLVEGVGKAVQFAAQRRVGCSCSQPGEGLVDERFPHADVLDGDLGHRVADPALGLGCGGAQLVYQRGVCGLQMRERHRMLP